MVKYLFILFLLIAQVSCKKSETDGVMISIENNTGFTLDSVKLFYDTTNYNYGTILPGKTSALVFFKSMSDAPAIKADSMNNELLAGYLIPPNSYSNTNLANGKYVLQIFPDSRLFYRYGAKYIKK